MDLDRPISSDHLRTVVSQELGDIEWKSLLPLLGTGEENSIAELLQTLELHHVTYNQLADALTELGHYTSAEEFLETVTEEVLEICPGKAHHSKKQLRV